MKSHHSPGHWIAVALVLAFALLTLSNLHGQRSDGAATFRGRPVAGAQGGTGAQAGLPQGGAGQQGTEAERTVVTWPAQGDDAARPAEVEPPPDVSGPREGARQQDDAIRDKDKGVTPRKDSDSSMTPKKDSGMAKEERSATKKAKKAAKSTAERSKYGVSPFDSN